MIRAAVSDDVPAIFELIDHYAGKDFLLKRTMRELAGSFRDFLVYGENGKIAGCVALHRYDLGLAEIRSLAVKEEMHGKGIGKELVQAALASAKNLAIPKVFTLTIVPEFFEKLGFRRTEISLLPQKIKKDCKGCPKEKCCGEAALEYLF